MILADNTEDYILLNQLAQGSEYAFQVIFEKYRNHLYNVAISYVKSPYVAEEIIQDSFMKLWINRAEAKNIRSVEAWLHTVVKNLTFNRLKKIAFDLKRKEPLTNQAIKSGDSSDTRILEEENNWLLQHAVKQLSSQQKKVFFLAKEEGLTYQKIGEQLHLSPLTVKKHMSRALISLRTFLKNYDKKFIIILLLTSLFF